MVLTILGIWLVLKAHFNWLAEVLDTCWLGKVEPMLWRDGHRDCWGATVEVRNVDCHLDWISIYDSNKYNVRLRPVLYIDFAGWLRQKCDRKRVPVLLAYLQQSRVALKEWCTAVSKNRIVTNQHINLSIEQENYRKASPLTRCLIATVIRPHRLQWRLGAFRLADVSLSGWLVLWIDHWTNDWMPSRWTGSRRKLHIELLNIFCWKIFFC